MDTIGAHRIDSRSAYGDALTINLIGWMTALARFDARVSDPSWAWLERKRAAIQDHGLAYRVALPLGSPGM